MLQIELLSGFSELKDVLIRTYKIEKSREKIRLYFTEIENQLLMHDYHDHKKVVVLSNDVKGRKPRSLNKYYAEKLVQESLHSKIPSEFLNQEFLLSGFFVF